MSAFLDAIEAVPFSVWVIAILAVLACAGLVFLAFVSIPDQEVSDLDGWDDEPVWTHERATREHLERQRAERIAQHMKNGRWS